MRAQLAWIFSLWVLLGAGCAGSGQTVCRPDPISGSDRCQLTGGSADAAITGGVAAGLWAAKGCTINGCEPPFTCNPKTKLCERQPCSETRACAPGYVCQATDQRCH